MLSRVGVIAPPAGGGGEAAAVVGWLSPIAPGTVGWLSPVSAGAAGGGEGARPASLESRPARESSHRLSRSASGGASSGPPPGAGEELASGVGRPRGVGIVQAVRHSTSSWLGLGVGLGLGLGVGLGLGIGLGLGLW